MYSSYKVLYNASSLLVILTTIIHTAIILTAVILATIVVHVAIVGHAVGRRPRQCHLCRQRRHPRPRPRHRRRHAPPRRGRGVQKTAPPRIDRSTVRCPLRAASSPIRTSDVLSPTQFNRGRVLPPLAVLHARACSVHPKGIHAAARTDAHCRPSRRARRPSRTIDADGMGPREGRAGDASSRAGFVPCRCKCNLRRRRRQRFLPHRRNARRPMVSRIAPAVSAYVPSTSSDLWRTRAVASACSRCRRASRAWANGGAPSSSMEGPAAVVLRTVLRGCEGSRWWWVMASENC
jgi:hypothetical protein